MKLGKLPAKDDKRTLMLTKYAAALPTPPKVFGFGTLYANWGMLGNDRVGDCVPAGGGHETELWNHVGGHEVQMSTPSTLADYSAITGYDPSDPSSDQGTYVLDANKFRVKTGYQDMHGARHKIAAYVSIDAKDWDTMVKAAYTFGVVGIGFEFPDSAFDQFDNGEYWDVVSGASIEGGHYVPVVGSRNSLARVTVITWARRQQMTKRFYEKYNDEAWVYLSEEQLNGNGQGIHHLDLAALKADLALL